MLISAAGVAARAAVVQDGLAAARAADIAAGLVGAGASGWSFHGAPMHMFMS